ncbi:MAG: sugar ABC transporter [Alphaproteobacteria bacterium]|jgi:hypothetical protein|nr:sugar ABC transporter [Alphaproteobacteria bacterium]
MVECGFADPAREDEWNAWYGGPKIASLVTLPQFTGSQRFKAEDGQPAPYLAIHGVAAAEFFESDNYKGAGGGSFNEWQDEIVDWRRSLYDGMDVLPEVETDQRLAVLDGAGEAPGIVWLDCVGLDRSVPRRGLAVLEAGDPVPEGARVFHPMTGKIAGD